MTPLPKLTLDHRAHDWVMPAKADAVRDRLIQMSAAPPMTDLPPDLHGLAQIVLAEVLNNIVEHAHDGLEGEISVTLWRDGQGLACRIIDGGRAMPGGQLPAGGLPEIEDQPLDDLPEGGFGWHLIRSLTAGLQYRRIADRNELDFLIRDPAAEAT
jgi:serine/threonine-protein kinase RsbW